MLSFVVAQAASATTRMYTPAGPMQWLCFKCAQWVGVPTVQVIDKGVPIRVCQYCVGACR